ncbi:MAG: cytochrome P450 [Bosea sp. (in: a-proteobacteria)]
MMLAPSLRINGTNVNLDPRDVAFVQDPYPVYDTVRAIGPAFFWEQYGHWCFASHDAVSALLKDRRFGRQILHVTSREALGWPEPAPHLAPFHAAERHSLLELEPPDHARLRGLVNRAFVSRQVERLRPRIAELAHRLIDGFVARGEVDLLEAFATPIPVIVIAELLGVPPERAPDLLRWSHAMVAMYQFRRSRQIEDEAAAATKSFVAFLRDYIRDKRRRPADDLISTLIAATEAGERMSEDELISTCILVLNAGHEATVHAIGNGVKALLEHGVDIGTAPIEGLIEEVLRFDAPLHMFTRYALEDCEAFGVTFKQGEVVGLLLGAANRDPARFAKPHNFDAGRTPNAHVSFGAGIHFCVGAALARLELAVALPILFQRLPGLRLASKPVYRDTYHFHGLERLDVRW